MSSTPIYPRQLFFSCGIVSMYTVHVTGTQPADLFSQHVSIFEICAISLLTSPAALALDVNWGHHGMFVLRSQKCLCSTNSVSSQNVKARCNMHAQKLQYQYSVHATYIFRSPTSSSKGLVPYRQLRIENVALIFIYYYYSASIASYCTALLKATECSSKQMGDWVP